VVLRAGCCESVVWLLLAGYDGYGGYGYRRQEACADTRGSKGPGRLGPGPSETLILPWQQDRGRRAIRLRDHPHAGAANVVGAEEPSAVL
jgi:hypothetical protein